MSKATCFIRKNAFWMILLLSIPIIGFVLPKAPNKTIDCWCTPCRCIECGCTKEKPCKCEKNHTN